MIVHRAGAVLIGNRAVLIEGEPGSGKSTLALSLIDRGAQLIGDDGVTVAEEGGRLWVTPPPNTAGLMEIRNVGVVKLSATSGAAALVIRLDEGAPRFRDHADQVSIAGVAVPLVALDPRIPVLALRAEHALQQYGIDSA